MKTNKKRKAWELTCCPFHASRPSHCPVLKNEQRRSPRRYDIAYPYSVPLRLKPMMASHNTLQGCKQSHPEGIYRCRVLTVPESCEVSKRQNRTLVNAYLICRDPTLPLTIWDENKLWWTSLHLSARACSSCEEYRIICKFIKNECNDKRKHIKSAWQTTKLYNNSEALTHKRSRLR